jgi:SAM-dependent methyltransferase
VEPDAAMLTELRHVAPSVRALPDSAEAIPLPDSSVDAVVAGNLMHWFAMEVAGPEIARVLAQGGVLASLWNLIDEAAQDTSVPPNRLSSSTRNAAPRMPWRRRPGSPSSTQPTARRGLNRSAPTWRIVQKPPSIRSQPRWSQV